MRNIYGYENLHETSIFETDYFVLSIVGAA